MSYLENIKNNFCHSLYKVKILERSKALDSSFGSCEVAWVQIGILRNSVAS